MNQKLAIDIHTHGEFTIATFLAREDMQNIGVLLQHSVSGTVICIDVPHFNTVKSAALHLNWHITHVLVTHHHWDHVEGLSEIKDLYGAKIYGTDHPKIMPVDILLKGNEHIDIDGVKIQCFPTKGHTFSQIAYHFTQIDCAFLADAVFHLSCGRILQGTLEEMYETLQRVKQLPINTKLWYGHNYLKQNSKISEILKPKDVKITQYLKKITGLGTNLPFPVLLTDEIDANLMLRATNFEEFAKYRILRDRF